jgi:hypothetical protein
MLRSARQASQEGAAMKKQGQLSSPSLLSFFSFLTLALILALFATPAHSADVTLAWDPNSEPDLAGYKLYYKTESSGPPYDGTGAIEGDSPIDVGNVTEFTVHGLTDGVTYFFVLTAHDTEGLESDYSNEVNTGNKITLSITSPQNGFSVNASNYTSYTVSGIAEALAAVEIFAGPISLGTTTALADDTWSIDVDFTPCDEGTISLTAESGGSISGAVTGTYDRTLPNAPVITTDGGNGPGNDYATDNSSIILEGSCSADTVAIYVNGSADGVTYTAGQTSWTYTGTLQTGANNFTIIAKDAAGNASDAGSITVTYSAPDGLPAGGYSADNVIPAAQITQSANGDGIITIGFKIKDPTNDPCTLHTFHYSVDGGNTWSAPTNGDSSGCLSSGWQDKGGAKYSSATSFNDAEVHSYTFNTKHQDVTGLEGEDQSDVQIRFTVNDGTYDSLSPVTSEDFRVDNLGPAVSISYSAPNSSHVDVGTLTITATSSELLSTTPQVTVDRPNPMSTIGPVDMTGWDTLWTYAITIERHNGSTVVDGVNLVTISNVSDLVGNAVQESSTFITDTRDTDSDGERDYIDTDDDNDGLPDTWEEDYGLDPLDSVGDNGRDGDLDNDGWTNYEEYIAGTNPADDTSFPELSRPEIVETIPHHDAGLNEDTTRIPNDTSFCVWIEDSDGIDITDSGSISFTISDGVHEPYERDLSNETVVRMVKLAAEEDTQVTKLWAVYDRSNDDDYGNSYAFDSIITIGVDVKDRGGIPIDPVPSYTFKIESEIQHHQAHDPDNLPDTSAISPDELDLEDPEYVYNAGIQVNSGDLEGAKIIYNSNEPVIPRLGPMDEIPSLDGDYGVPMNLQPPTVFNTPVKILIPYPGGKDVSDLHVYLYKAGSWVHACDNKGELQPGGEAWMVQGSRVDHNDRNPSTIEIKMYHLSAVQAKPGTASSGPPQDSNASISANAVEVGGGCFIAATAFQSNINRAGNASPGPVHVASCCGHPLVLLCGLILLLLTLVYRTRPPSRSLRKSAQ